MSKHGHTALFNYIDDLLYCDLPSKIQGPSEYLVSLLQELGFTMSDKKLTPSSTQVVCLGILFDTVAQTISIPPKTRKNGSKIY